MQSHVRASLARQLAVDALVDPRTLTRYLNGMAVSPMCALRIERALRRHGLERLVYATRTSRSTSTEDDPPTAA